MELLDLFQISWPVSKAGYEIEDGTIVPADKERERRALDELDDLLESYIESHAPNDSEIIVFMNNALERLRTTYSYNPFDYPSLFMEFAGIKEHQRKPIRDEALLEFANRYGLLIDFAGDFLRGVVHMQNFRQSSSILDGTSIKKFDEAMNSVSNWKEHINRVNSAISLWHAGKISDALDYVRRGGVRFNGMLNSDGDLKLECNSLLTAIYLQLYFAIKGNKKY